MVPFCKYSAVKDRYCVCYLGHCDECLLLLQAVRPAVEAAFPGLRVFLGCRDDRAHLLADEPLLLQSEWKSRRHEYGHVREIRGNGRNHPVEDFLAEVGLEHLRLETPDVTELSEECLIVPSSCHPTRPLTKSDIHKLSSLAENLGFRSVVGDNDLNAGLVMGVESAALVRAALRGIPIKLAPTGVGTRLYKHLFTKLDVLA